jgi:putative transposase
MLPAFHELQKRVNQVLAKGLPKNLLKSSQNLAIDLTLLPYYGQPLSEQEEWDYRSKAKDGTNHFHAYATCYVVKKGFRYTIGLTPVVKGEKMQDVIQRLIKQWKQAGVSCKLLLVDRGFYSVEAISYMKHAQIPFVTPLVIRGKEATKNSPAGGTRK